MRTRLDSDVLQSRTTRYDSNDYEESFSTKSWTAVNKSTLNISDHSKDVNSKNASILLVDRNSNTLPKIDECLSNEVLSPKIKEPFN